jgi:hypothetical protein
MVNTFGKEKAFGHPKAFVSPGGLNFLNEDRSWNNLKKP